ncbi:MAG: YkgJ family cysteine cluster protein [Candidatus Bathyarchaeia archaeon]
MRCSGCGKCCYETEMELSSEDIKRLVDAGYSPEDFIIIRDGVSRLRNVDGWCYFYSPAEKKCRVYSIRPLGCRLYPVVYVEREGAALDEFCPMRHTVSKGEFRRKAKILKKLLEEIARERVLR